MKRAAAELWAQARADFSTATLLADAGAHYASAFFSQQSAEKSLKALSLAGYSRHHRGHDLIAIADYLHAPLDIMNCAADLNRDYDGARYPDDEGNIPCLSYSRADAAERLQAATRILEWARETERDLETA